jgi:Undecaprenyl-phosphate galactose phosphotransferase WbaP
LKDFIVTTVPALTASSPDGSDDCFDRLAVADTRAVRAKRVFDVVVAFLLLLLLSPVMLIVMVSVWCDGGPAVYRQRRLGLGGRSFDCIKFRSMEVNAESRLAVLLAGDPAAAMEWQATQKLRRDPRVTRVGHFIRSASLDELPQLLNVLKGDMSLVGPRPIVQAELRLYGRHVGSYVAAKPGLTGLWQISGRSNMTYQDRVRLDVQYVQTWTFWRDIVILLRTIPAVLCRDGAV